jgi:TM2 domain-containing membrane protein YozV
MAKFCPNCGNEVNENQAVCLKCGVSLSNQQNNNYNNVNTNPNAKSKIAAGLLGIFLGSLGIHNFYLGYTGKAVAQLLITLLSCGILAVVSEIWGLIEGILILCGNINTDAQGNPLKD